jgi:hypothetical protein
MLPKSEPLGELPTAVQPGPLYGSLANRAHAPCMNSDSACSWGGDGRLETSEFPHP